MKNEISELIHFLKTHKRDLEYFDSRTDRQSGIYIVQAGMLIGKAYPVSQM